MISINGSILLPSRLWEEPEWPWMRRIAETLNLLPVTKKGRLRSVSGLRWNADNLLSRGTGVWLERVAPELLVRFIPPERGGPIHAFFALDTEGPGDWERLCGEVRELASQCEAFGGGVGVCEDYARLVQERTPSLGIRDWLCVVSAEDVAALGREYVASTPAYAVDFLPHGAALVRVCLTPGLDPDEGNLRAVARVSAWLSVPPREADTVYAAIVAGLYDMKLPPHTFPRAISRLVHEAISDAPEGAARRALVAKWDGVQPRVADYACPAGALPPVDVPNRKAWIDRVSLDAERLRAFMTMWQHIAWRRQYFLDDAPEALVEVDDFFCYGQRRQNYREDRAALVRPAGAFLGEMLVDHFGGKWHPRQNLAEAAVIVNNRAWKVFALAERYNSSLDDCILYSLFAAFLEAGGRTLAEDWATRPTGPRKAAKGSPTKEDQGFNVLGELLKSVKVDKP